MVLPTKDRKKRVAAVANILREIAKLPIKSKTASKRHHLFLRLVMLTHAYPIDVPPGFLEECAQMLADSENDDDNEFILAFFPQLKAAQTAEGMHAAHWAEAAIPPKNGNGKRGV